MLTFMLNIINRGIKMEITACPKCGSRKIFQGNIGEGVLTGYTSRNVCKDCGYQGMPLIFDSEKEYKKFLEGLSKDKECKEEDIKQVEQKVEKQVIKNRPMGIVILSLIMILDAIFAILLYYYIVGFDNISWWIYYIVVFLISAVILPFGLLKGKPWAWTIGGMLYALSIPLGLVFLYYITRPHVREYFGKNIE